MRNNATVKRKDWRLPEPRVSGNQLTQNKTITCPVIINKTAASRSTRRAVSSCLQNSAEVSRELLYISTFNYFDLLLKIVNIMNLLSLYNVHNYRALVQLWKVEQRHNSFLCLLFFYWFGFGYSFIDEIRFLPAGTCCSTTPPAGGCRRVAGGFFWPKICLKEILKHKKVDNWIQ